MELQILIRMEYDDVLVSSNRGCDEPVQFKLSDIQRDDAPMTDKVTEWVHRWIDDALNDREEV